MKHLCDSCKNNNNNCDDSTAIYDHDKDGLQAVYRELSKQCAEKLWFHCVSENAT